MRFPTNEDVFDFLGKYGWVFFVAFFVFIVVVMVEAIH
jgi:hypothetical protein